MSASSALQPSALALPSRKTLFRLFAGGYIALMAWEIWARVITAWVLGGPLEPPQLVISLVQTWTGIALSLPTATFGHYVVGIVGYPLLYWIVSRNLPRWPVILDAGVWLAFTLFMAVATLRGTATMGTGLFWLVVTAITATRAINPSPLIANCLSWGSFTWFNALGIFAPLAGLPFLLMEWGGELSFMSYVGHILFGFIAALVFETLESRDPG
ncbi:hypothetical protein [uncultured Alsobacter sp.]|uniref:hypothetical protein n=1 Tax=uncultured Alsobacter sp. TaxID=1748258 RepID=UPI0025F20B04|nr:hypothetical protein [uncultured Alsobacter sp.]